ncbi:MAG TPA: aminodeoxychorismate/anthranilate synthase component II [Enhygromyxa sp.]|nr:aminodeoxychorismate/anthranilate synthase component II [Enhygromyxa sp.]
MSHRVIILDNYDSFVYNLYQAVGEVTGVAARVVRNDAITIDELLAADPTHLIISPGPGTPEDPAYFGVCRAAILQLGPRVPTLGVCLGHQGIAAAFGGRVVRAPQVMHGKTSLIEHDGSGLFAGLSSPLRVMRYHSLVVDPASLPEVLVATSWTHDGVCMSLAHREWPIVGVQFHPESIGTQDGKRLLGNFLAR